VRHVVANAIESKSLIPFLLIQHQDDIVTAAATPESQLAYVLKSIPAGSDLYNGISSMRSPSVSFAAVPALTSGLEWTVSSSARDRSKSFIDSFKSPNSIAKLLSDSMIQFL